MVLMEGGWIMLEDTADGSMKPGAAAGSGQMGHPVRGSVLQSQADLITWDEDRSLLSSPCCVRFIPQSLRITNSCIFVLVHLLLDHWGGVEPALQDSFGVWQQKWRTCCWIKPPCLSCYWINMAEFCRFREAVLFLIQCVTAVLAFLSWHVSVQMESYLFSHNGSATWGSCGFMFCTTSCGAPVTPAARHVGFGSGWYSASMRKQQKLWITHSQSSCTRNIRQKKSRGQVWRVLFGAKSPLLHLNLT